jgi:hypothetical protein
MRTSCSETQLTHGFLAHRIYICPLDFFTIDLVLESVAIPYPNWANLPMTI